VTFEETRKKERKVPGDEIVEGARELRGTPKGREVDDCREKVRMGMLASVKGGGGERV